jgi:hypothetical protein
LPSRIISFRLFVGKIAADHRHRAERHRVDHQFHELHRKYVLDDVDLTYVSEHSCDFLFPSLRRGMEAAETEPRSFRRRVAFNLARREAIGGELRDAAERSRRPNHLGDDFGRHPVLHADKKAVFCEIGIDQLRVPAGVIGLGHQQDDIEDLVHRHQITEMVGSHGCLDFSLSERYVEPFSPHCLDMGRPLVDEHNIEARVGEVRGDATAIGTRSKHCDFLIHC